ncbi:unnamed protein product [Somion occarium]|uniref:Uncharacterized protein n=1 Tax=Somion occarium TaxID=3059160 RepID=A0ABP1CTL7_9APHY
MASVLQNLGQTVREYFLQDPSHAAIFVPILLGEALEDYNFHNLLNISTSNSAQELEHIKGTIEQNFPSLRVSSNDKACGDCEPCMEDRSCIELHGRIVGALTATQDIDTLINLRFILVVIIIHSLGHVFAAGNPMPLQKDTFPFYHCNYLLLDKDIAEPGFFAEEGIFGGIIGIVFKNEENGLPGPFLESDLTKIDYLFLYDRTGAAYRLDTRELANQLNSKRFGRFEHSQRIQVPEGISERTCAAYNGDHLPIKNIGPAFNPKWLDRVLRHGDLTFSNNRFNQPSCVRMK